MEKALTQFLEVANSPYSYLAAWKKQSQKKIIGCFPMYLPEEIVHAAGMLPVVLWDSDEPITLAHSHFLHYNCAIARSVVDDALKGKLDFLDGIAFYDLCLQVRGMYFIFQRNTRYPYLEVIHLPPVLTSPLARGYMMENLMKLKRSLEEFSGQEITPQALRESVQIYNTNRGLLRRLYHLRRERPGILRAKEMQAVVQSSMLMPKEEHNRLLEQLLAELNGRRALANQRIKVVLSGHLCLAPPADILDLIEDLGMAVVYDDLYVGSRYFVHDVPLTADPLEGLASHFLRRTPSCPTKVDPEANLGDQVVDLVKSNGAQGAVFLLVKFCPPMFNNYAQIQHRLIQAEIPETMVETEHGAVSLQQARTRLQAFVESIGGV